MRRNIRFAGMVAIAAALLVGGCDAGSFVTGTDVTEEQVVSLRVYANVAVTGATKMQAEVTGSDISNDLVFDIPVSGGIASGSVHVPSGAARTFTLRAFDAAGDETHRGATTTDVQPSSTQAVEVRLAALKGGASISATVGSIVVAVTPAIASTTVGGTTKLTAVVLDSVGNPVNGNINWATLEPTVASVDKGGVVTGISEGTARIVATYGSVGGSSLVQVQPQSGSAAVDGVAVSPQADTLAVDGTVQLSATLTDANGNVLTGRTVTWASSDTNVATVTSGGLVTARGEGSASITATSEGKTGSASITVSPAAPAPVSQVSVSPSADTLAVDGTVQLSATLTDANGNVLSGRSVSWSTSDSNVATVSSSGLVTARGEGSASIVATSEGKVGSASIIVNAPAAAQVAQVRVSPQADTVAIDQTTDLTATLTDANGNTLSGRTVTWSSSSMTIATVSKNGVVRGNAVGTATITATSEGQSGTATITVGDTAAAPASDPAAVSDLGVGSTTSSSVTLRWTQVDDGTGSPAKYALRYGSPTISWGDAYATEVTVSGTEIGQTLSHTFSGFTAGTQYQFQIVAYRGTLGQSGVVFGPVSGAVQAVTAAASQGTITITPAADTLVGIGDTLTLTVEARDANGNLIANPGIQWSSNDPSIISVNSMGRLTAQAVGVAVITASAVCCSDAQGTYAVTDPGTQPPALVAGTPSASAGDGQVSLSASAASGGTTPYAYQWHRSTTSGFTPGSGNAVSGLTSRNDTDTGVANGTTYYYRLVVTDADGSTATYSQVSATPVASTQPLQAGTASASGGDGQVSLSATAPSGGVSPYAYQWHRSTTSGFSPGSGNAVSGLTSRSDTDTGLNNGTTYYYRLVVTDNAGTSAAYPQVSATPTAPPPTGSSEPTYNPSNHTMVFQDDMEKYTDVQTMGTVDSGRPEITPYPSPVNYPGSWNSSQYAIITGRGGSGQALRINRAAQTSSQQSGSFLTNNIPSTPNGAHHFYTYWGRVRQASYDDTPLAVKWFMAWHDNGERIQWSLHWGWGFNRSQPTYWGVHDGSTTTSGGFQPVGPYFNDLAHDGQWHRFTYEYRPNSSPGARDGIARMWVDGVKIIDISRSAVGVTPPGGEKVWCNWDDVDALSTRGIINIHWGSTQTSGWPAWTLDIDDVQWWTAP